MRIIVYDIEITTDPNDLPNGWDDAKRGLAGVSALALYDSETGRVHTYDTHTVVDAIEHLNAVDLLVGFNIDEFDRPALQGYANKSITTPQFDILTACRRANRDRYVKGYKLTQVAERTLGLAKTGSGAYATVLAAQGRWGELFDYCINDVHLTRLLYNYIVENGYVIGVDGEPLALDGYPQEQA